VKLISFDNSQCNRSAQQPSCNIGAEVFGKKFAGVIERHGIETAEYLLTTEQIYLAKLNRNLMAIGFQANFQERYLG
jgi:hypothetical protein